MRTYIEQTPFLPWLGFCEALFACGTVVLLDTVQYTERGWQNRNRVKGPGGPIWVSVPVEKHHGQILRETRIAESFRPADLLATIRHATARCPHGQEAMDVIAPPISRAGRWLADLNLGLVTAITAALGANARLAPASGVPGAGQEAGRIERIARLCRGVGADTLWAGEGTRGYLDEREMHQRGIAVQWNRYPSRHPTYRQAWERQGFAPGLSVADAAANLGWAGTAAMLRANLAAYLSAATTEGASVC